MQGKPVAGKGCGTHVHSPVCRHLAGRQMGRRHSPGLAELLPELGRSHEQRIRAPCVKRGCHKNMGVHVCVCERVCRGEDFQATEAGESVQGKERTACVCVWGGGMSVRDLGHV